MIIAPTVNTSIIATLKEWRNKCQREDEQLYRILSDKIRQIAPKKQCPSCGAIVSISQHTCHQCYWKISN